MLSDDALDERLAFVGTSGAGKTYASKGYVERLLSSAARVCVVDPLGVWFGLRYDAAGEGPGFPIAILGGEHGDVPLTEGAGAAAGRALAGSADSAVVDLSGLGSGAARRRFMAPFLEALYEANREPLHVVFDEADLWAPQRPLPDQNVLLSRMEEVVRRGRVRGFIPWLITQRPAVLHKDVLSQADTLIAMKLTSSQDRDAIGAWIEGQADRADGKRILADLPRLQKGDGYLWAPGHGLLERVTFPPIRTFDSSRTPKRGERVATPTATLAPLDLSGIREKLAEAQAEAEANDPAKLKKRIAELERQAQREAAGGAGQAGAPSPEALAEAERRGYERGYAEGSAAAFAHATQNFQAAMQAVRLATQGAAEAWTAPPDGEPPRETFERAMREHRANGHAAPAEPVQAPRPVPAGRQRAEAASGLPKAERLILTALAQYQPGGRTKAQVAILTGYAVGGGGFNNSLSSLRKKGWIDGSDRLAITAAGLDALGPYDRLPVGPGLLAHWMGQLGKAERSALEAVAAAYPRALSKEEAARRAGYEPSGGGFNNALSRLRTLELIGGRGELRASDALFG